MRVVLSFLVIAVLLGGCAMPGSTSAPKAADAKKTYEALTEKTHKLGKFLSLGVPSFDGTVLHVDVQLPDGDGPFPTMLTDTPYALLGEDAAGAQADAGNPYAAGYVAEYVAYGYAVAVAHVRGTGESGGCLDIGGPEEGKDGVALVEWIAKQPWSNRKVAMIGTSYDGTTPLETAVLAPPHLTTIVPISAVTEWYRYYFELGLHRRNGDPFPGSSDTDPALWGAMGIVPGARTQTTGGADDARCIAEYTMEDDLQSDYDAYWHARDHHRNAGNITAPMLMAQGWNDGNVATTGFPSFWANVTSEKRLWLQQHGHGVPAAKKAYHEYVHRWLDHYLLGKDNGALDLPQVVVETNDGKYRAEPDWPPRDATNVTFRLAPGKLSPGAPPGGSASYHDDGTGSEDDRLDGVDHLTFSTDALPAPLHLAGAPTLALKAATDASDTQLDAKLYDESAGVRTLVTRGFLDAAHRESLDHAKQPTPGTAYWFVWDLHPNDYVVAAGHKLVLVVKSTDDYVVRSPLRATNTISFGPDASWIELPTIDDSARAYADAAPAPWV